ncbi:MULTISPECIES: pyridoxamine kinase [Caproicibacterium]|uniref:pyridoxal kinase n=1 Tax=Caproicibacterium argilliputei TaxID=3030016 RepID=A0AA97D9K9_9FIRM|nr:pyridoxamine kinase [Caproicibacterium argilliputei]WOC32764.1 pyridoxamine kinase [Caproicibacterium argilliputei]
MVPIQKRVAAIHDLSGFGKCSLSVILPVLSSMGHEVCCVPTAVLSSHTGGLSDVTVRDLTPEMPGFLRQWSALQIPFDGIYTGFLGSAEQLRVVHDFIKTFRREDTLVMVDPAMADNGSLYRTYTPEMAAGTKQLCREADLIVPNMTEACLLLGEPYREGPYTRAWVEDALHRLTELGPRTAVMTGVWFSPELLGAAGYDRMTGELSYALSARVQGGYHGTGDLFAAVLLGALLRRVKLRDALQLAVDFTAGAIRRTREARGDPRWGVCFEPELPRLIHELGL